MGGSESLFDGVAGLTNHQQWMDVIGNNIANVNTTGFKDQQFNFADVIYQTLKGASSAVSGGPGGTDFSQTGLGVHAGSIISNQQQGSLQTTNLPTDFAIQGDGLFIVNDGAADHYTRDSNFIVDGFGNINSASTGFHLRGYGIKQVGNSVQVDTSKVANLTVPQQINPAQQTNALDLIGNLQSSASVPQTQSVGVFDSLGQLHNVVLTFTPPTTAGGNWAVAASSSDLAANASIAVTGGNTSTPGNLHFNALGQLDGTITPLMLGFKDAGGNKPAQPWVVPGTTTSTNAIQAATQLNINDPAVGTLTSFASATATSTQAVPDTAPLLGTQNNTKAVINGNLQRGTTGPATLTFTAADDQGFTHTFSVTLTGNAAGDTWTPTSPLTVDGAANAGVTIGATPITYNAAAPPAQTGGGIQTVTIAANAFGNSNGTETLTLDLTKVTNSATLNSGLIPPSSGSAGNSAGGLKDFNVDQNGVIHGVYTNGFTQTIGQILLAGFENPGGLEHEGNNNLQVSANSGVLNVGIPGTGKFGTIAAGNVETSNVDLANEFSNMILAERGFQANSKIITTSDTMLQDEVNLKQSA